MSLLAGILLGALFFGGGCGCPSCKKARAKKEKEYRKWLKKHPQTSGSVSISLSPSVSQSPSIMA